MDVHAGDPIPNGHGLAVQVTVDERPASTPEEHVAEVEAAVKLVNKAVRDAARDGVRVVVSDSPAGPHALPVFPRPQVFRVADVSRPIQLP